jgi:hypothetical protein
MNEQKVYKVLYTGFDKPYVNYFSVELATSEREAVKQSYFRAYPNEYYEDNKGNVYNNDHECIMSNTEISLYHKDAYFIAEPIKEAPAGFSFSGKTDLLVKLQTNIDILFNQLNESE